MHTLSTLRFSFRLHGLPIDSMGIYHNSQQPGARAITACTTNVQDSLECLIQTPLNHPSIMSTSSVSNSTEQHAKDYSDTIQEIPNYGRPPTQVWYCCNCGDGPYTVALNIGCAECGHKKDRCCPVTASR